MLVVEIILTLVTFGLIVLALFALALLAMGE